MPALSLRRSLLFALALVAFVATLWTPRVAAWDDQDHEIFDLVDYLKKVQKGQDRSFYDILGVDSKATLNTLNQAFRRKSLEFHPDKNPSEEAQALFTRLGPIMKILRNPAIRERYDFFMKNGVPVWRGTGYFYRRYRPGFFSVLFGLVFFSAGIQYLVQWLNYTLTVRKIEHYRAELLKNGQGPT
ncbi:DnaJ domain-containing protein, partial [Dimargaris cristalligena]